jgi:hypothetical protein
MAPARANHRYGEGRATVRRKQTVRIIIEMRYLRCLPAKSFFKLLGAEVIEKLSCSTLLDFLADFMRQEYEARAVKAL